MPRIKPHRSAADAFGRFVASPFGGRVACLFMVYAGGVLTMAAVNAVAIARGFA